MDDVFKALADPTRRQLLDTLRDRGGLTLTELEQGLGMTRFGVMKHLKVLEAANLVVTRRDGRFKYHYLNALPIQEVADRWMAPYGKPLARFALDLKHALEGPAAMADKRDYVLQTYIRTTQDALWDALTNPDSIKRQKYYDDLVEGTPTMLLNGKTGPVVGGLKQHAEDRYQELRKDIGPLLEKAAGADVSVSAERKGDKIDIKATVKGLKAPSEKIKLRIVVVEDHVRYQGRNGMLYHSRVVRDMPGGAAGFPLVKEESEHTASVDLGDLRKRLDKYLDKFEKEEDPFPDSQRPMRLKSLSIVAFVQNDATREVLQATDVKVKGE